MYNNDKVGRIEWIKLHRTYLVGSLDHALLPLHLDVLLLFGVGKSPWDTEKESTGADDPERLSAERNTGLCEGGDGGDSASDSATGGGRDNIFQGGQTVEESLSLKLEVGFGGDLGLCNSDERSEDSSP